MKYYIATRLSRVSEHNDLRDQLQALGHEITYDWTIHGNVRGLGRDAVRTIEKKEKQGVKDADFVIVLLPGGRGTHVEIGMSIAWEHPIIMHADPVHGFFKYDDRTSLFYHDEYITPCEGSLSDIIDEVKRLEQG